MKILQIATLGALVGVGVIGYMHLQVNTETTSPDNNDNTTDVTPDTTPDGNYEGGNSTQVSFEFDSNYAMTIGTEKRYYSNSEIMIVDKGNVKVTNSVGTYSTDSSKVYLSSSELIYTGASTFTSYNVDSLINELSTTQYKGYELTVDSVSYTVTNVFSNYLELSSEGQTIAFTNESAYSKYFLISTDEYNQRLTGDFLFTGNYGYSLYSASGEIEEKVYYVSNQETFVKETYTNGKLSNAYMYSIYESYEKDGLDPDSIFWYLNSTTTNYTSNKEFFNMVSQNLSSKSNFITSNVTYTFGATNAENITINQILSSGTKKIVIERFDYPTYTHYNQKESNDRILAAHYQAKIDVNPKMIGNYSKSWFSSNKGSLTYSDFDFLNYMDTSKVTDMTLAFYYESSAKYIPTFDTSSVVTADQMFYQCRGLLELPELDFSNLESAKEIFNLCTSAVTAPSYDFSKCTTVWGAFRYNSSLVSVGEIKVGESVSAGYMFAYCGSLKETPVVNYENIGYPAYMFQDCTSLTSFPSTEFTLATSLAAIFNGCTSLKTVGDISAPIATTLSYLFDDATRLTTVGEINVPLATTFSSTFSGCTALETVGDIYAPSVVTLTSMFESATSLVTAPNITLSSENVFSMKNMFYGCKALTTVPVYNIVIMSNYTDVFTSCTSLEIPQWYLDAVEATTTA